MAFDGDLESLPITDLIQLLHATGKSGTLTLSGPKGESQLVFDAGYIVSANHVNTSMRIGRILVDMEALSPEALERALKAQAAAGQKRGPLIAALLEAGTVLPAQAYKGLEILIELTIVEVLTWSKGAFSFDATKTSLSDEYRYFPEKLKQQIHLNTQSVLMDALRIYDERKRDGTLMEATFFGEEEPEPELSPELLGLDALDDLETTPAEPFHGLDEEEPGELRRKLNAALPGVAPEEEERLAAYLQELSRQPLGADAPPVILLTADELAQEAARWALADRVAGVAATDDDLFALLRGKGVAARAAVVAGPDRAGDDLHRLLASLAERHPCVEAHLLLRPGEHALFAGALASGAKTVIPWPAAGSATVADDLMQSCDALRHVLRGCGQGDPFPPHFLKLYRELVQLSTPAEITLSLLRFVSGFFPRAVTLVLLRGELVAEKGIGFGESGAVSSLKLRIPLNASAVLRSVTEGGELYYGEADILLKECFAGFGAPDSEVLLLPVQSMGRVVALLYADWGDGVAASAPLPFLQLMAQHAGLVLDNALYRKRVSQGAPRA